MTLLTNDTEVAALHALRSDAADLITRHPVVAANTYTRWFATGAASDDEVRHLTVQFSVFSHQFVAAQLHKVINAADLDTYRAGKEILMNELGVIFKPARGDAGGAGRPEREAVARPATGPVTDVEVDPALVATDGSVDGSRFKFAAAHFEWLLRFAGPLGLGFADLGKRRHGTASTLHFCDELLRIYGSDDPSIAEGASYAVEHWAAAGFWKELIAGLSAVKAARHPDLDLAFWTWHDKVEDQHAAHTDDELAQAVSLPGFEAGKFLAGAADMLDGVQAFWDGLWTDHLGGRSTWQRTA